MRRGKKNKITWSLILAGAILINTTGVASAITMSAYASSFTKAWKKTVETRDGHGKLTYGYNTFLINEDISWGSHISRAHYASLKNAKGSFAGPNRKRNSSFRSKIEVQHKGSGVSYHLNY